MTFLIQYPVVPAILAALVACLWLQRSHPGKHADWFTVAAVFILPMNMLAQALVYAMSRYRPAKLDLYAFQIDAWFGQPSFAMGRFLLHHAWLRNLSSVTYSLLPAALLACFGLYLYLRSADEARDLACIFAANWFVLPGIYWIVPICGPLFAFPQFPTAPGVVIAHTVAIAAPPNGMPSGHFACALLILWFLRHWWWGRSAGAIFAALTAVATLGSGQHYLIDLIASVPYTAGVLWAGAKGSITIRRCFRSRNEPMAGLPGATKTHLHLTPGL